jgi:hypothetical protein
MSLKAGLGWVVLSLSVGACQAAAQDGEQGVEDELRSDPSAAVSTSDPAVRVLSGYNSFLDRATPSPCVVATAPQFEATDVRGSFFLRHIKTREELAKELDVELGASVKAPAMGSVDASTKMVKTFKQTSTTVTFLVRAVRSYVVLNRSRLELTREARALLERGATQEFIHTCGGSFAQGVRYEAQVLGMLQFEAKTEESARTIEASLGASGGKQNLGSATGDLKSKAQSTASKNDASLSLTVTASGFVSNSKSIGADIAEHTFEKIDSLHKDMSESFDRDLKADREDYAKNQRNLRATVVSQASYGALPDRPSVDFTRLSTTLARAEEFLGGISPVYLRMERAFDEEIMRFLSDGPNQFRYNMPASPKLRTSDLVPIAEKWAAKFGPDGSRGDGVSLVEPLRRAIDRCTTTAANGNYDACTTDPALEKDKAAASAALAEYARAGRVLPLLAWMPRLNAVMSFRNAASECADASMRLPTRSEMPLLGPAVSALASPSGEVWFAGDAACSKPFFSNAAGQGKAECGDTLTEPLPFVTDRPVICVGRAGPVSARGAP